MRAARPSTASGSCRALKNPGGRQAVAGRVIGMSARANPHQDRGADAVTGTPVASFGAPKPLIKSQRLRRRK
jgi:hypothetical protein